MRLAGMTLGGKLSLGYLIAATFALVLGGRGSEWVLVICGFPLVYSPWAYEQLFGGIGRPWPAAMVVVAVLLWVANAYLWGYAAAAVVGWLGHRFGPPSGGPDTPRPGH